MSGKEISKEQAQGMIDSLMTYVDRANEAYVALRDAGFTISRRDTGGRQLVRITQVFRTERFDVPGARPPHDELGGIDVQMPVPAQAFREHRLI